MLKYAGLNHNDQNMIVGQVSGDHNVQRGSSAPRSENRNKLPFSASHKTEPGGPCIRTSTPSFQQGYPNRYHAAPWQKYRIWCFSRGAHDNERTSNSGTSGNDSDSAHQLQRNRQNNTGHLSFFQASHSPSGPSQAVMDSGACASLVGNGTLKPVQRDLGLPKLERTRFQQDSHRFGDRSDDQLTLYAIKSLSLQLCNPMPP